MATLILTTVGSLAAGPIGGALGAIVGQRIDQELLAPRGRRGPRLGDLAVQTSSYGTAIPKLFGTMRVAGTVIWSTDLREERTRSGGKGRPKTTSYSYSASFAVALSARPIRAVKRIWADGNLLRGEGGDFKSELGGFRLHAGGEDQPVDPLIASAEGAAQAPAYRGTAYAVFEDFQLADYGNRIPSLTFELEADAGPVSIGDIAATLSANAVTGAGTRTLHGYAASGDSVRAAIETLAKAEAFSVRDDGETLVLGSAGAVVALPAAEFGAAADNPGAARRCERGRPAPGEVSIAYYDPARDYQAGLQRARRPGAAGAGERIELAAALDAGAAKAIVETRSARAWTERERRTVTLPFRRATLGPGALVSLEGQAGSWRVVETTLERMVVELALVRHRTATAATASAQPGRPVSAPDLVHGPSVIHLFELPDMTDDGSGRPMLHAAAAGASEGWRGAALSLSFDGGASWRDIGVSAGRAVIGATAEPTGSGSAALFDDRNTIEVTLLNGAMTLEDTDDARLIGGANLALLGEELIQFGRAEPLGQARWRLTRLLRGRRGTEHAIAAHAAGTRFVLIEAEALTALEAPASALGGAARVMATGRGDSEPAIALAELGGRSVRPPSPVGLAAEVSPGGHAIRWTRRSRAGWRWIDAVDAPLGEERERYRLTVRRGEVVVRTVETDAPGFDYSMAMLAEDAAGAAAVSFAVAQIGTLAASLETMITITN